MDLFHANSGVNNQLGGLFRGKSVVYSDLNHAVLRIMPKYASEAADNAILVSSHIDTVFAAYGSGILEVCSMVAINLLLYRILSGFSYLFFFRVIPIYYY